MAKSAKTKDTVVAKWRRVRQRMRERVVTFTCGSVRRRERTKLTNVSEHKKKCRVFWSDQEIRQLLNLRLPMHMQFEQSGDKRHLWNVVAERLRALGVRANRRDCDLKWRGILKTYRANRIRADKLGIDSVSWPYFQFVDEVVRANGHLRLESDDNDDGDESGSGEDHKFKSHCHKVRERSPRDQDAPRLMWTDQQIKQLLSLRLPLESAFQSSQNKGRLWRQIALDMRRVGVEVEAEDCAIKWRNVLKTYRKNRIRADAHGDGCVTWPYFRAIDYALSHQIKAVDAPETSRRLFSESESDRGSSEVRPTLSRRNKRPRTTSPASIPPAESERSGAEAPSWFIDYANEQERKEEERWKEFLQLERDKLERTMQMEGDKLRAIEALTGVLNKLLDK